MTDGDHPVRLYWMDDERKHKALRLVYRMGSNEYWGVQMSDWKDAPVLGEGASRAASGSASTTSTTTDRSCTWSS